MAYGAKSSETFTGGSGQMAVMSELLQRKCNAAIPVIDVGTDVFAFRDDREEVARIQVKTASVIVRQKYYNADFRIPLDQLKRTDSPQLFYALVVRHESRWGDMLIISRAELKELREAGLGTIVKNGKRSDLKVYVTFLSEDQGDEEDGVVLKVRCGDVRLTKYLNAWESLPPLKSPVPFELPNDNTVPDPTDLGPPVKCVVRFDEIESEPL